MLFNPELHGQLGPATDRARDRDPSPAPPCPQPAPSFRQAIGHQFIRIGARLAAEPSLESARSR